MLVSNYHAAGNQNKGASLRNKEKEKRKNKNLMKMVLRLPTTLRLLLQLLLLRALVRSSGLAVTTVDICNKTTRNQISTFNISRFTIHTIYAHNMKIICKSYRRTVEREKIFLGIMTIRCNQIYYHEWWWFFSYLHISNQLSVCVRLKNIYYS